MAYINCKKCGCQMSDKSEACPICGTPVNADVEEINKTSVEKQPKPENPIPNEQPMKAKEEAAPMEYNTPTITPPPITPSNKPTKKSNKTPIIIGVVAAVVILGALSAFLLLRNHKTNESETQMAIEVPIEFDESYDESISYNSNETKLNGYEWIVGTWACDMGPYGTVVVKFDGDGSSGMCTEAQYGSFKTGTYNVSGNTLCYKLDGESVTTTIEIESEHRLAAGGGYYYHKRDSGDVQRYEDNNASTTSTQVPKVSSNAYEGNQVVVIDGSELRLRLGPSTSSDTFKWPDGTNRHPKVGDKFKYLGESGDFYKIDFNGHELWVSKQFTHVEEGTVEASNVANGLTNEYEWILGEWKGIEFKSDLAIITRDGIVCNNAVRSGMLDEVEPNRSEITKQTYEIKKTKYDFDNKEYMSIVVNGDSAYFRDGEAAYFLDLKSKVIFYFYDFDQKITLKKVK